MPFPKPTDKEALTFAIDRAILALGHLKARVGDSDILSTHRQAESAEDYCRHAERIIEIHGDLLAAVVEVVAELGGSQRVHDSDLKALRHNETVEEVLSDVRDWCEEVHNDEEAA